MTKILGIGGCGRNILNRLIDIGFDPDMVVYMYIWIPRENLEDGLRMKKPTKAVLRPFEVRELKREDEIT